MMDTETKRLVRLNVGMHLASIPVDVRRQFRRNAIKHFITEAKRRAALKEAKP